MVPSEKNSSDEPKEPHRPISNKRKVLLIGCLGVLGLGLLSVSLILLSDHKSSVEYSSPQSPQNHLPEFPWPPRASAYTKIPPQYLVRQQGQTLLKDVAAKLELAYRSGGYGQTGYYSVPGGFALVSQLEQFKPNGLPADEPYRWSQQIEISPIFSLKYFSDLIRGKVGRYRVIVFAVSNDFFSQVVGRRVGIEQASTIAIEGANELPSEVGDLPYTDKHTCTALIYEFEKALPDRPAEFKENSSLLAEPHLQKILPYLQR